MGIQPLGIFQCWDVTKCRTFNQIVWFGVSIHKSVTTIPEESIGMGPEIPNSHLKSKDLEHHFHQGPVVPVEGRSTLCPDGPECN